MKFIDAAAGTAALIIDCMRYFFTDVVDRLTGEPAPDPLTGFDFMAQQLRETLIMAACGACVAFMFQAYNGCIKRWQAGMAARCARRRLVRGALVILDIIFCIIAGIVIAKFWFKSSYGRLSVHEAFGLLAGLAVGLRTFAVGKSKRRHTISVIYVILIITAYFVIS